MKRQHVWNNNMLKNEMNKILISTLNIQHYKKWNVNIESKSSTSQKTKKTKLKENELTNLWSLILKINDDNVEHVNYYTFTTIFEIYLFYKRN